MDTVEKITIGNRSIHIDPKESNFSENEYQPLNILIYQGQYQDSKGPNRTSSGCGTLDFNAEMFTTTLLNLNQEGISLVDDTFQCLTTEYLMMFLKSVGIYGIANQDQQRSSAP